MKAAGTAWIGLFHGSWDEDKRLILKEMQQSRHEGVANFLQIREPKERLDFWKLPTAGSKCQIDLLLKAEIKNDTKIFGFLAIFYFLQ